MTQSLLRRGDFARLWLADLSSTAAQQVNAFAVPLIAILVFQAGASEVGLIRSATSTATLVVVLLAGALVDWMPKRTLLLLASAIQLVAVTAIPIFFAIDAVSFATLVSLAVIAGAAAVSLDVGVQATLPGVVDRDEISAANSFLEGGSQAAGAVSPAIAGLLSTILRAPWVLLLAALLHVIAFVSLLGLKVRPTPPSPRVPLLKSLGAGFRYVFGHHLLRPITVAAALSNFAIVIVMTLLPVLVANNLAQPGLGLGVILAAGAMGGVAAATVITPITRALGFGRVMVIAPAVCGAALLFISFSLTIWGSGPAGMLAAAIGMALANFGVVAFNVAQVSVRQSLCRPDMLGRVNSTMRFTALALAPIGALLAGALGEKIPVYLVMAGGATILVLIPALLAKAVGGEKVTRAMADANKNEEL